MLRNMSKKPNKRIGIPMGAATIVTDNAIPAVMRTKPIRAANRRPVNFIVKVNRDQMSTNGKSRSGVLL
jgi:hypothetical protein